MPISRMQHSFLAGELSDELIARVDIEAYQRGAAELFNVFVDYKGGAVNRPGTQWVFAALTPNSGYETDETQFSPRLVPFIYDADQSLVLVFSGDGRAYIMKDGAPVLAASPVNILDITQADPGVLNFDYSGGPVPFGDNDIVYIESAGGMTELNNRYFLIDNVSIGPDTFELKNLYTGENIDTSAYGAFTGGGTVTRVALISHGYAYQDLWTLKFIQSRDTIIIVSPSYPPRLLTRVSGDDLWTLTTITFVSSTVAPTGVTLSASFAGSGTDYSYVITATDEETGVESEASVEETGDLSYWPTTTDNIRIDWNAVTGAAFYSIYRAPVTPGRGTPTSSLFGLIGQTRGTRFDDSQIAPNFALTPPKSRTPFNTTDKYPACVAFIQQRVAYGATNDRPFKIWTTPVGDFTSMNRSQPPRDTDALAFEIASQRADPIKNLLAMPGGLLAFTSEAVYHIYGGADGSPLTPNNINSDPVSYYGASNLTPLPIGYHILYTQNEGSLIRDLQYNFFAASYDSTDITILAAHLLQGHKIVRWAFANSPWKVMWAVRSDGRLLSLTYVPEANVFAFALHETLGFVKDVCVIPEGNEDAVYLAVCRKYGDFKLAPFNVLFTTRMATIERMATRKIETITDAWFLDDGLASVLTPGIGPIWISAATGTVTITDLNGSNSFAGSVVGLIIRAGGGMLEVTAKTDDNNITAEVLAPITDVGLSGVPMIQAPEAWYMNAKFSTFSGLWHLEGQEVWALADGGVQGPFTVTEGAFTLTEPASYVVAGLPYESRIKSLRLELETQNGTIQGKDKTIPAVTIRLYKSRGVEAGSNFDVMYTWPERTDEPYGQPPNLVSGDQRIIIEGDWNTFGQVCIRQTQPLPMQVLGLIPEVTLGDT